MGKKRAISKTNIFSTLTTQSNEYFMNTRNLTFSKYT